MAKADELLRELSEQLTIVRGATELVRDRMTPSDHRARDVETALQAADSAIGIVRRLRLLESRQRWPKWWARGSA